MLQYLPERAAVGDLLGDVARWLRPDGFGVIATDVVDPGAGALPTGGTCWHSWWPSRGRSEGW